MTVHQVLLDADSWALLLAHAQMLLNAQYLRLLYQPLSVARSSTR